MSRQKLMFYGGFHELAEAYVLWWFSRVGRSLCSMVVFHAGAMLINNGSTGKELHSYKQFQVNTNKILQIV